MANGDGNGPVAPPLAGGYTADPYVLSTGPLSTSVPAQAPTGVYPDAGQVTTVATPGPGETQFGPAPPGMLRRPGAPPVPGAEQQPQGETQEEKIARLEAEAAQAKERQRVWEEKTQAARERVEKMYQLGPPKPPQLRSLTEPPPDQRKFQQGSLMFASSMALVGALAGRASRSSGNAALKAYGAALDGWQQGNLQAYTNATNEWKERTEQTIKNNNIELKRYDLVLNDRNMNIQEQYAAMGLAATEFNNNTMMDGVNNKNIGQIAATRDKLAFATKQLEEAAGYNNANLNAERTEQAKQAARWHNWIYQGGNLQDLQTQVNPKTGALYTQQEIKGIESLLEAYPTQPLVAPGAHGRGAAPQATLTPQALENAARNWNATGKLPTGISRASANGIAILNRAAQLETDPEGQPGRWQAFGARATGLRVLAGRAANLTLVESEVKTLIPRVNELIDKVSRTKFADINSIMVNIKKRTDDPNEIRLGIAINSLVSVYARMLKPTGTLAVADFDNARDLMVQKWGKLSMRAALGQMELERQSTAAALDESYERYGGGVTRVQGAADPQARAEAQQRAIVAKTWVETGAVPDVPGAGGVIEYDAQGNPR